MAQIVKSEKHELHPKYKINMNLNNNNLTTGYLSG